jgi:hypothetical protein
MYAIEFETTINNGIVQVPQKYTTLQKSSKAKVIILVDEIEQETKQTSSALDCFLRTNAKVEKIQLFNRNELHER